MPAIIATYVVLFAAYGVTSPSWAAVVLTEQQKHVALAVTAADIAAVARPVGDQAWLLSTRAEANALASVPALPNASLPITGPGAPSTTTRMEPRSDDPERSNMALMVLVALAMLMTVVVKGNRA